jgi:hypothetical protein
MYGKKGQKKSQTKGKKTPTVSLNESDEEPQVLRVRCKYFSVQIIIVFFGFL